MLTTRYLLYVHPPWMVLTVYDLLIRFHYKCSASGDKVNTGNVGKNMPICLKSSYRAR